MMRTLTGTTLLFFAGCAYGQSADAPVTFEVASIKAAPPPDHQRGIRVGSNGGPGTNDPGRWTAQNLSLSNLVSQAYDLKRYQLTALDWMEETRFDINAKVPEGATKEQFRLMLQNLLAERFKLAFHREKKEMPVYELVVAKNGPKLKPAVEQPQPDGAGSARPPAASGPPKFTLDKDGFPELPPGQGSMMIMTNGRARMRQTGQTMQQLAGTLANQVGKPVIDATGLPGKYDVTLSWATGNGMPARIGGPGPEGGGGPLASMPEGESGPTIFGAIQEQLGLKMEQKKGSVEILVVDKVEKTPTEN